MPNPFSYPDVARPNLVGPQYASNNAQISPRAGKQGDLIVSELWGKYGEMCQQGQVYIARVGTAAAVPVNSTLTNAPSIWNTSSSNKLVVPLKVMFSVGAIGTPILQGFTLSYLTSAGDNIATAAPVVTWTNQAPVNALLGSGGACVTKFSPAVSTYTTNPTALYDLGGGHFLEGTAASGQLYTLVFDLDCAIQMKPGTTLHVGSTIATSTTYYTTIVFAELPLLS